LGLLLPALAWGGGHEKDDHLAYIYFALLTLLFAFSWFGVGREIYDAAAGERIVAVVTKTGCDYSGGSCSPQYQLRAEGNGADLGWVHIDMVLSVDSKTTIVVDRSGWFRPHTPYYEDSPRGRMIFRIVIVCLILAAIGIALMRADLS
jgi:hypothetical protein